MRLACIHGERHREHASVFTTTVRYSLSDIPVPRPATGLVEAVVACGSCESRLPVRVFSPATRRRWKLAWSGMFVVGALIATPSTIRLLALDALGGSPPQPYVLPLLATVFGLGTAVMGARFFVTEDGVRLTSFWGAAGHRLRRW
ncbi:hypothetical protein [Amycolatopsis rifamycinica]|uniref:Uncharacterized protein n=1 Tax=Amycolatopsis rifamycinica TaxID=287986 RepID=A0A066U313_9PSEU|nr:hypothetical protein [Amycolatopsis rifamycinica]KDN21836.1 hypothetical protein DV20_12965 [Amycolatopsis rifamycinica]